MLDVTLFGAFVAGLVSFLSPCILPLVPPYLCWLAGMTIDEFVSRPDDTKAGSRIVLRAAAFVTGFGAVFVALGASASLIGQWVADHLTLLSRLAGLIIILFGLHFLGVLRIPLLYREARLEVSRQPAGLVGAFVIGTAFGFGWTPCVGPVLTAILFLAGAEGSAGAGARLLAAYAAGIGIPFLLAAAFAPHFMRFLKRFRPSLGKVEKVMGVMLLVTGLLILTDSMRVIGAAMLDWLPILGRVG